MIASDIKFSPKKKSNKTGFLQKLSFYAIFHLILGVRIIWASVIYYFYLSYNGQIIFSEKGIEFAISKTKSTKTFKVPNLVN